MFLYLQHLFRCDHVFYTVVPVTGVSDIDRAFVEHTDDVGEQILLMLDLF